MRMWMVDPKMMCGQHITGEHHELHLHRHNFEKGHSIAGRVDGPVVLVEPEAMKSRHDELAAFLKHKSPFEMPPLDYLSERHRTAKVDVSESIEELRRRCPDCRKRIDAHITQTGLEAD